MGPDRDAEVPGQPAQPDVAGHQPPGPAGPGAAEPGRTGLGRRIAGASPALRFVLLVGVMSFFADFTYEGSRSVIGPYLGTLGAGALAISVISGLGEFLGYGLRLFSGRGADRTGRYWPITIGGYVVQMAAVPLLALAGNWEVAALLIIAERVGKATRNPPRDAMLSHAAREMGYGWGFGVHEALDQFGAMFGPLLVALILAVSQHDYQLAFAALAVPGVITLSLVLVARRFFPRPAARAIRAEAAPAGRPDGGTELLVRRRVLLDPLPEAGMQAAAPAPGGPAAPGRIVPGIMGCSDEARVKRQAADGFYRMRKR